MAGETLAEQGMTVRREVLGDEYVDRAIENTNSFNQDLQSLVQAYCWGAVWTRDGLDRKTRSLINLGMLTALNRNVELETHVRGAVNNGCSAAEISEVFLQAAIYCGIPAALDASRIAEKIVNASAVDSAGSDGKGHR